MIQCCVIDMLNLYLPFTAVLTLKAGRNECEREEMVSEVLEKTVARGALHLFVY